MVSLTIRSFVLVSAFTSTAAAGANELNSAKFKELTTSELNGMVKFFQPWCGHCTAMKPAWDQLADAVDGSVFIADVNCSDEDELCSENGVSGYPTIKVYKDGDVTDYSGGRSFDELMEYVDLELSTKCDIKKLLETCSERAAKFVEKWKDNDASKLEKEIQRLSGMANKSMNGKLKGWLRERLHILRQFGSDDNKEL